MTPLILKPYYKEDGGGITSSKNKRRFMQKKQIEEETIHTDKSVKTEEPLLIIPNENEVNIESIQLGSGLVYVAKRK